MIEVQNLTKRYGTFVALDSISFSARQGEILGFLGPNGAGKTTTMRILTGYMPPTEGSAQVAGYDVFDDSLEVRRHVGYLPETVPLYRDMTVRGYLDFLARLRDIPQRKARIDEVLARVGMTDRARSLIRSLSKGMRQRVGLAQAIVHNPDVLILDEPTIGLDPHQVQDVRALIRELGQTRTVMISTHILSEAEQMCDRIVIIDKGRIAADGSTESLKEGAKGEQAIHLALLHAEPGEAQAALESVEGVLRVERTESRAGDELRLKIFASSADGIM